jgi:hypothetical protein
VVETNALLYFFTGGISSAGLGEFFDVAMPLFPVALIVIAAGQSPEGAPL